MLDNSLGPFLNLYALNLLKQRTASIQKNFDYDNVNSKTGKSYFKSHTTGEK
jgi:hypothetical protein